MCTMWRKCWNSKSFDITLLALQSLNRKNNKTNSHKKERMNILLDTTPNSQKEEKSGRCLVQNSQQQRLQLCTKLSQIRLAFYKTSTYKAAALSTLQYFFSYTRKYQATALITLYIFLAYKFTPCLYLLLQRFQLSGITLF